ncbi:MAG: molybdopterin-dependent oxidoreductase [Oscillospiraceae bacterium]|nr:molybdopterin-dependent oxidoreductase [Oscillospiraceae bacterium]
MTDKILVSGTLFVLDKTLNALAAVFPDFKEELLKKDNLTVQLKLRDNSYGRCFTFKNGKVTGRTGIFNSATVVMVFEDWRIAREVVALIRNQMDFVNAAKQGQLALHGPDEDAQWFAALLLKVFTAPLLSTGLYGTKMKNGEMRYVNGTNGGPVFVYVKDGKIVRMTPIDFDETDADTWTITARGKKFSPPRRTTLAPHAMAQKGMVYSPKRILYPMKRVDFDVNGERNYENRGVSGYERISWDEALDIVCSEMVRVRKEYGPGTIFGSHGSHHTWGNVGYYLSCLKRFFNVIGATTCLHNPDSWEGFCWGAVHHYGGSTRNGGVEPYNTVEDCMQNAEMIVFWSSDPESTSGVYAAQEGTIRRNWIKDLGIEVVHIDPYLNSTASFLGGRWISPRPATDTPLALAIAYTWITEGLYDKDYVATRTYGFDVWKKYLLGEDDGVPKSPEWQEAITGVEARVVRALAREWGSKKTYLAAGGIPAFGSACRTAFGTEWARAMVCLLAMQGWGKPGINFGGLQYGTPLDSRFHFPGYADGGFSGDCVTSGAMVSTYNRVPQTPSLNSVRQQIPRLRLPEAIMNRELDAFHVHDVHSVTGQFQTAKYPAPGFNPVKMYYKYGGSHIGTQSNTSRFAQMYRCDSLQFVVNQSIWFEGECKFADVILPACTNFERWDVGEMSSSGGYIDRTYLQNNHRVIFVQHKCIEPLGESKSDFDIFYDVCCRLGLGQVFCEGNSLYDWVVRYYNGTDMPKVMPWAKFIQKGYYVVPPLPENRRDEVAYRWFVEGGKKNSPELTPLPSEYAGRYAEGLQTQTGLFEFECNTLKRFDPNDEERLPICTYIPSFEGRETTELYAKYPLQMISPHAKFSFHTMGDGKEGYINEIEEHRIKIDGYYYWVFRMNADDAAARGLKQHDLVEVFNDRGYVICALDITNRLPSGTVHSYESCADYDPLGEPGVSTDRAGCVNILTPERMITKHAHGLAVNSCLVEVRKWDGQVRTWEPMKSTYKGDKEVKA